MAPKLSCLLAIFFLASCEQPVRSKVEYRPGDVGTVDHALCLLGFSAVPVRPVEPGHHLIRATINEETSYFVLDTGANVTVVDVSQAGRFGLAGSRRRGSGAARLAAGVGQADRVAIQAFVIGTVQVRQNHIVTADLGQLLGALSSASGVEVAGIIGQDVLNEHRAIIDVARPMLYLMEEDRNPAPVPSEDCHFAEGATG
jgi:hypothetical protein